jgi:hypothetical protein
MIFFVSIYIGTQITVAQHLINISKCQLQMVDVRTYFIVATMTILSYGCAYLQQRFVKDKCIVDEVNLTINGNDPWMKDTIKMNCDVAYGIYRLSDYFPDKSIMRQLQGFDNIPFVKYAIHSCADTVWAKKQMISILTKKYNAGIWRFDTIRHIQKYKVEMVDYSKLSPPRDTTIKEGNYRINSIVGYLFENDTIDPMMLVVLNNIDRAFTPPNIFGGSDQSMWLNLPNTKYDHVVEILDEGQTKFTYDSYLQHVRDKHGMKVTKTLDTIVPHRTVYFNHRPYRHKKR